MPEKSTSSRETVWKRFARGINLLRRRNNSGEGSTELRQNSWQDLNVMNATVNREELERRKQEIQKSKLQEYYREDFMGMQVFEGPLVIGFVGNETEVPHRIQVRLILDRVQSLESPWGQFRPYPENETAFGSVALTKAWGFVFDGHNRVKVGNDRDDADEMMAKLVTLQEQNDQEGEKYPLTIIFAEGDVDQNGQHMIASGTMEMYPTSLMLDELAKKYPIPPKMEKIPVVLCSCNENILGIRAKIEHERMLIAYRDGLAGGLNRGSNTGPKMSG